MVWKIINGEELSKFRIKYIFLKKKDFINIIFWYLYCGNKIMFGFCEKGNFYSRADVYVDVYMKGGFL